MNLFPQKSILDGWHTIHTTPTDYDVYVEEVWSVSGAMPMVRAAVPDPWRDKFASDTVWVFQVVPKSSGMGSAQTFMFDDMVLCEIERVRFLNATKTWKARRR